MVTVKTIGTSHNKRKKDNLNISIKQIFSFLTLLSFCHVYVKETTKNGYGSQERQKGVIAVHVTMK